MSSRGMTLRVLSVGQCHVDDANLREALQNRYEVEVVAVDTADEALTVSRAGGFVLVLVNRIFDVDGDIGLDLIRRLKADPATAALPVMLVSNFADAQAAAVSAGALPGFGKASLHEPTTLARLDPLLKG